MDYRLVRIFYRVRNDQIVLRYYFSLGLCFDELLPEGLDVRLLVGSAHKFSSRNCALVSANFVSITYSWNVLGGNMHYSCKGLLKNC